MVNLLRLRKSKQLLNFYSFVGTVKNNNQLKKVIISSIFFKVRI